MKTKITPKQLTSKLIKSLQTSLEWGDAQIVGKFYIESDSIHFHDGSTSPVAWNDVQALEFWNEYVKKDSPPLLRVPDVASEGYNKHYHTSEFDGGAIPGVGAVHDHRDNAHGGFAFAVYHPSTGIPQMGWEETP